jgi:undecaprenyl-diphosphatase
LAGLAGFSVVALLFGVLIVAVRVRWLPLESVDRGVAADLNRVVADRPALVSVLKMMTLLGSNGVLGWLVAIGALILLVRKRWRLAGYLLVTCAGGLILDPTLKLAVGRLRPVVAGPVALGGGNSFPSGHALASVIGYGALLLVFTPALPRRARKPVIIALAAIVVLVGFSRLALGVHYLSDVLGAWCLGIAWLGATAYAFEVWRRGSGKRVTAPLSEGLEPEASADLKPTGPATEVPTGRIRAVAGSGVAWVLVFGVLCAIGVPLARYHHGNGNILGDLTIPHWLAAHRSNGLNDGSQVGSTVGNTHAILFVGLIVGAIALAAIRRWRPVIFLVATMFGELTLFLASAAITGRQTARRVASGRPTADLEFPVRAYRGDDLPVRGGRRVGDAPDPGLVAVAVHRRRGADAAVGGAVAGVPRHAPSHRRPRQPHLGRLLGHCAGLLRAPQP